MSEPIITKTCRICKQTKPLSEFYKNLGNTDGHRTECKVCRLQQIRKYDRTEKRKVAKKEYAILHRAEIVSRIKRYRQTKAGKATLKRYRQTDKYKATKKRYYQSKKGKIFQRKKWRLYCLSHPKQAKAKQAIMIKIRAGKLPCADTLQCHYCPKQAKEYHHHKGYEPEHWLDVVPVCLSCHYKLHKKTA